MRRFLCLTMRKRIGWSPLLAVAAFYMQGDSSEALFRDVSGANERVVAATNELNAYYAKSPGFKYAKAILIDTAFLEGKATQLQRERTPALPASKRSSKYPDERIIEWEGTIPESLAKIELFRVRGKFYGSYREKDRFYVITPYRSGGEWMTMVLVYDSPPLECGTTRKNGEEVEQ